MAVWHVDYRLIPVMLVIIRIQMHEQLSLNKMEFKVQKLVCVILLELTTLQKKEQSLLVKHGRLNK